MKTDHTPGPWRNPKGSVTVLSEQAGKKVCDMSWGITGAAQAYANARLIAAAPDLLEACNYVVKYHREHDSGEGELFGLDFVTTCIRAIAKATGGE